MARYKETGHKNWKDFPSKACFQMNDTHPTIAVAELMRLLIDQEGLDWEEAWSITTQVLIHLSTCTKGGFRSKPTLWCAKHAAKAYL